MDGELKDVVEMIVDKTGLLQAFRAEGTMESESRAENIQEFLGVAAEFEETHEDIEGTLESLEELRAAGVADVPASAEPEPVVVSAPAPEPGPSAPVSSFEALVGARDAAGSNPLDSLAAPALSPQDALAAAIAGNAYAAPTEMPAGAVHADEIERTYGPLTCKALPALMEWLALRSDLDSLAGETHAITMMTIHSAKGLEFPVVFVVGKAVVPDKSYAVPAGQAAKETEKKEEKKPEPPKDPEVQKLLQERERALSEMRRLNDSIKDEKISAQIDHLEEVTGKIIDQVVAQPKKRSQIRRFLDYYLPTTLKLLNAYDRMAAAGVDGENISVTKEKIEDMMDTIVKAFDKQLDGLFGEEALDVSTDITVMENLLAREGLAGGQIGEENGGVKLEL